MAKVRLGDIATVVTKGTTPTTMGFQFEDGGINFVKIESISEDGTFLKEKFSHISDECNVQMRRSQLQENDILFSIAGAIGRSAIVTKEILPANTNQALAIIRVPKGKIDYNYLLYALSSSAINQQATQHQQGVAQLNISLKNVSDFLLPIYTKAMQKQIVHNLKKIDKLISLRKQQLTKLDELVKARFVEMFGDAKLNPYGFPCNSLSEYILFLTSGSRGWSQYFTDNGEYFITIKNVKNCRITLQDVQYVIPPDNAEAKRTKVQENDLLISITADLGRTGVVPKEIAKHGAYINQHLTCIRLNLEKVNPIYVAYYMESDAGKEQFASKNQSAVKAGLNFNAINSLKLIVPPLSLQNDFAAFVERVDQQKQTVQQSLEKLELMKKALMQEYFG